MGRRDGLDRDPKALYLHALRAESSQTRGLLLEDVVATLLRRAHFDVEVNAGVATPRQTDLVARYGPDIYVVEAKWWKRHVGTPQLDELRSRMDRAAGTPIGVLISTGGFAVGVEVDVLRDRKHPILLVSRGELERSIAGDTSVRALLRRKQDALFLHGQVLLDQSTRVDDATDDLERYFRPEEAPSVSIQAGSGESVSWMAITGEYDVWLPTLELPDPDWSWAGLSQSAYTRVAVHRGPDTVDRVLDELTGIGWHTSGCGWTLRQAGRNWIGFGRDGLREAMAAWKARYRDLPGDPHHTEEVAVVGQTNEGGFWIIEADVDGHPPRWVTECHVTLVLSGWPLDPEPLRRLFGALRAQHPVVLRPLTGPVVIRDWQARDDPVPLDPTAKIIAHGAGLGRSDEEWVIGLVVKNPGTPQTAEEIERSPWRAWIRDHDQVPVALQSWHLNDDVKRSYTLKRCEWSVLARSVPGVLVADWQ